MSGEGKRIRVLLAKPGLDGHDRGVLVVGQALRDAGMEVIYSGLKQTCEAIVEAAIQEDVDLIGISILSGAHMSLIPRIMELLDERGCGDIPVVVGGIIPPDDARELVERHGVRRVFGPGSDTREIASYVERVVTGGEDA